jgi:hypothetical protein
MLLDVLNGQNMLNIKVHDDSERFSNRIKIFSQETIPYINYYMYIILFYIRHHYKLIIASLFLILSFTLTFFSIENNWRIPRRKASNNYSMPVRSNNQEEIEKKEIKPEVKYSYVNTPALNMRTGPSAESSIITQLHQNDRVQILSTAGRWSLVLFSTYRGYVNYSYLSDSPIQVPAQQTPIKESTPEPRRLNLAEKDVKEKE